MSFRLAQVVVRVLAKTYKSFFTRVSRLLTLYDHHFYWGRLRTVNNIGNVAVRWPGKSQPKEKLRSLKKDKFWMFCSRNFFKFALHSFFSSHWRQFWLRSFIERDVDVGRRRQLYDDDSGREAETCRVSSSGIGSDPDREWIGRVRRCFRKRGQRCSGQRWSSFCFGRRVRWVCSKVKRFFSEYQLSTSQSTRWVRSALLSLCCSLL